MIAGNVRDFAFCQGSFADLRKTEGKVKSGKSNLTVSVLDEVEVEILDQPGL